ncbi:MAG TPA: hypothetical protein VJ946_01620, partial [Bacteroidales bacterium]|nr:hypothetical protein [Bacteroidales bacterium]
ILPYKDKIITIILQELYDKPPAIHSGPCIISKMPWWYLRACCVVMSVVCGMKSKKPACFWQTGFCF